MRIKDLKSNKKNPRKISSKKLASLKAALDKFGDLGCIVKNVRSGELIAGHQRVKSLPPECQVKIEKKYEAPNSVRTFAEGYIEHNGERFKYREVDADPTWEAEAMLAANKHGGQWDADILRVLIADNPDIDIDIAGFDIGELSAMNIEIKIEMPEPETEEQTDEEYIESNPGPDSELKKESITTSTNAFDETNEVTEPIGRRIILIIDCQTDEMKSRIKEQIRESVEKEGGKFF